MNTHDINAMNHLAAMWRSLSTRTASFLRSAWLIFWKETRRD